MIAVGTLFTFPIQIPAKRLSKFACSQFISGIYFVSQHTETLQKPYSKHTQTKEGSYRDPWPFAALSDSNRPVYHFYLRSIPKDPEVDEITPGNIFQSSKNGFVVILISLLHENRK